MKSNKLQATIISGDPIALVLSLVAAFFKTEAIKKHIVVFKAPGLNSDKWKYKTFGKMMFFKLVP